MKIFECLIYRRSACLTTNNEVVDLILSTFTLETFLSGLGQEWVVPTLMRTVELLLDEK